MAWAKGGMSVSRDDAVDCGPMIQNLEEETVGEKRKALRSSYDREK